PDRRPEALEVVDRPLPELRVAVEGEPAPALQPAHELGQPRALDQLGRRLPKQLPRRSVHGATLFMPEVGFEPTSPQGQSILSRSRMPVPPLRPRPER